MSSAPEYVANEISTLYIQYWDCTRNVIIYNPILSYRACKLFYHALILSGLTFNFNSFPFILSCWSFCAFLLASNFFSKHKSFKAPYTKRYRTRNVKSYPAFYLYTNSLVLKSNYQPILHVNHTALDMRK